MIWSREFQFIFPIEQFSFHRSEQEEICFVWAEVYLWTGISIGTARVSSLEEVIY